MKAIATYGFIILSLLGAMSGNASAQSLLLVGTWLTDVQSHVEIRPCKEGLCGYVTKVAIREKLYKENKQEIDRIGIQNAFDYFNKDPNLRSRRLLDLQILTLDKKVADNIYSGVVYNPEDGKTYSGKMKIINQDQIRMSGCAYFKLICRSEDWFRVIESE